MAPEVIKKGQYSRFSDIWSLGCTIIEMATGSPPWSQYQNSTTALYNIVQSKKGPLIPEFLSIDAKEFLKTCFKIKPYERANVCRLLGHKWIKSINE